MTNIKKHFLSIIFVGLISASITSIEFFLPWMLLTVGVLGFLEVSTKQSFHQYFLLPLMLIYLIWLFVVSQLSQVPSSSIMIFVTLVGMPVTYLAATNLQSFMQSWKIVRILLFLLGIIFSFWAMWQVYAHIGKGQASGPLEDRNAFAALINLLWFPVAYVFVSKVLHLSRWLQVLVGVGMFIMCTALFATASRGGLLAWIILLPILLWATYQYTKSIRLLMVIIVIAVTAYISSAVLLNTSLANRTFELAQDSSTTARLDMWQSTVKMAMSHPIFGTGWGTWSYFYPIYRLPNENVTAGFFAHNDYLQFAAEGGVVAMLLLLAAAVGIFILLCRNLKHATEDANFETITLLLGVLAIFMHAVVNFIFYFPMMNIVAGLYLARAARLSEKFSVKNFLIFENIRKSIKKIILYIIIIFISMPYFLHQLAVLSFYDGQPALKVINSIAPKVTVQNIANLILRLNPKDNMAQDTLLQTSEFYLANAVDFNIDQNTQRAIANQAVILFEKFRGLNANKPSIGLREARLLMTYHGLFSGDTAYVKAHNVLDENLKANPRHAKSIVMLSRLKVLEGHHDEAMVMLQQFNQKVLGRHDQQLIWIELLRLQVAPEFLPKLDEIEKELQLVINASENGEYVQLPEKYYENIDLRLMAVQQSIKECC